MACEKSLSGETPTAETLSSLLFISRDSRLGFQQLHAKEQVHINRNDGQIINGPANPQFRIINQEGELEEGSGESVEEHEALGPEALFQIKEIEEQVIGQHN